MYEERHYMIFNVSELSKVDFSQVHETSEETVRRSVDGNKTFVKWDGNAPEFISEMLTKEGPYTHKEILSILLTEEWTDPRKYVIE